MPSNLSQIGGMKHKATKDHFAHNMNIYWNGIPNFTNTFECLSFYDISSSGHANDGLIHRQSSVNIFWLKGLILTKTSMGFI